MTTKLRVVAYTPYTGKDRNGKLTFGGYLPDESVKWRIDCLDKKLDLAKTQIALLNDPSNVTPMFLMPEAFFQKAQGPFSYGTFLEIIGKLKALSTKYPSFLIVAGTIFWGDYNKRSKIWTVYKSVPFLYGGDLVHLTFKRIPASSTINLKRGVKWGMYDKNEKFKWELVVAMHKRMNKVFPKTDTSEVFKFKGIEMGIEVCADYGRRYLVGCREGFLDLHVVIAMGSFLRTGGVATKTGGYLLICDGSQDRLESNEKLGSYIYHCLRGSTARALRPLLDKTTYSGKTIHKYRGKEAIASRIMIFNKVLTFRPVKPVKNFFETVKFK